MNIQISFMNKQESSPPTCRLPLHDLCLLFVLWTSSMEHASLLIFSFSFMHVIEAANKTHTYTHSCLQMHALKDPFGTFSYSSWSLMKLIRKKKKSKCAPYPPWVLPLEWLTEVRVWVKKKEKRRRKSESCERESWHRLDSFAEAEKASLCQGENTASCAK